MAKIREKTLKKLKRKSFWPSIVLFLAFLIVSFTIVFAGIDLFATYIIGSKLTGLYEQAMDTGIMMERAVQDGESIAYGLDNVDH